MVRSAARTLCLVLVLFAAGCAANGEPLAENGGVEELLTEAGQAYEEGRLDDAEHALNRVLAQDKTVAEAWFVLANVHYRKGRLAAAVRAYEKTLRFDPSNNEAWHNLALTRVKQAVNTLDRRLDEMAHDEPGRQRLLGLRRALALEGEK